MRLSRVAVLASCATLVASFGLALAPTPALATSGPVAYPLTQALSGVTRQARMVYAHGELFISNGQSGSGVRVFSTSGKLLHSFTDMPGATGMVLSADGTTLYVAQAASDKITPVNTSALTEGTSFTVDSCPTYLALASGRLFYSFGCNEQPTGGVSSIDPSSGGTPVVATTGTSGPSLLAGGGTNLAVSLPGSDTITTYTSDDTGAVTQLATVTSDENVNDLAISSDGTKVYVAAAGGTQFSGYAASSLDSSGDFSASAYPRAVALSPNGQYLAGGLQSYTGLVSLYNAATSAPIWERFGASAAPSTWTTGQQQDETLPGSLTFSSNNADVYGLVEPEDSNTAVDLFSSTISPTSSSVHLTIPHVKYGKVLTATATGPAGGRITFVGSVGTLTKTLATVTANSKGVATLRFKSPYSGAIEAAYAGSAAKLPATVRHAFTRPSRARITLSGSFGRRHGITWFLNRKAVKAHVSVLPAVGGRPVVVTAQIRVNGAWQVASSATFYLPASGTFKLYLKKATHEYPLRFTVSFAGDQYNSGSHATSKHFEII
jgi:hypothetical protein